MVEVDDDIVLATRLQHASKPAALRKVEFDHVARRIVDTRIRVVFESCARERLLALGPQALSEAELLAVFLRTGIAGRDVLEIARDALLRFKGLNGLFAAARTEVEALAGFGPAKYAQLAAVIELARRALR